MPSITPHTSCFLQQIMTMEGTIAVFITSMYSLINSPQGVSHCLSVSQVTWEKTVKFSLTVKCGSRCVYIHVCNQLLPYHITLKLYWLVISRLRMSGCKKKSCYWELAISVMISQYVDCVCFSISTKRGAVWWCGHHWALLQLEGPGFQSTGQPGAPASSHSPNTCS